MTTAGQLRAMALALDGTASAAHFDRTAFKVDRIYVTLATDGKTANFKFTPDEQLLKCEVAPDAFSPVPNAWGRQGWTHCNLSKLTSPELEAALKLAWSHAFAKRRMKG